MTMLIPTVGIGIVGLILLTVLITGLIVSSVVVFKLVIGQKNWLFPAAAVACLLISLGAFASVVADLQTVKNPHDTPAHQNETHSYVDPHSDEHSHEASSPSPIIYQAALPTHEAPSAWDPVLNDTLDINPHTSSEDAFRALAQNLTTHLRIIPLTPDQKPTRYRVITQDTSANNPLLKDFAADFATAFQALNPRTVDVRFADPASKDTSSEVEQPETTILFTTAPGSTSTAASVSVSVDRPEEPINLSTTWIQAPWVHEGPYQQLTLVNNDDNTTTLHGVYRTPRLATTQSEAYDEALSAAATDLANRYAASRATRNDLQQAILTHLRNTPQAISNALTQTITNPYGTLYRSAVQLRINPDTLNLQASELEQIKISNQTSVRTTWFMLVATFMAIAVVYALLSLATQGYFGYTLGSTALLLITLAFAAAIARVYALT